MLYEKLNKLRSRSLPNMAKSLHRNDSSDFQYLQFLDKLFPNNKSTDNYVVQSR
jgi:hypothetical protein